MGAAAGRNMAGAATPYTHLPFFYSDLFDLGYEAVGDLDAGLETVADWKEPHREGVVYYLGDGRVRGVLLWNVWEQVDAARRLIAEPGPFRPRTSNNECCCRTRPPRQCRSSTMLVEAGRACDQPATSSSEQCAAAGATDSLTFQVKPVPPFRLDLTVQALRRRAINAVDRWDGTTYRRMLVVDQRPISIEVVQIAPSERPMLQVTVRGSSLPPSTSFVAMSALTRLLGVDRCLDDFYNAAADDPCLGQLVQLVRGLKPPQIPTLFEALINAFACQQVTLSLGIQLLNRLAATCARGWDDPGEGAYPFPSPDDLAGRKAADLRALGFSRQKGEAITELARCRRRAPLRS